jgi:hypothetical protein
MPALAATIVLKRTRQRLEVRKCGYRESACLILHVAPEEPVALRLPRTVGVVIRGGGRQSGNLREGAMSHVTMLRGVIGFCEHAFLVALGFVLMVLGLGLGVTMIMLPVGVVIGLIGFAMFVGGLFVKFNEA